MQIAATLCRFPHVCEEQIQQLVIANARALKAQTRNTHAFLKNLAGFSRQTSRNGAADVLPMRHYADERQCTAVDEYGPNESNVVEVRSAGVRIVAKEEIALADAIPVTR